MLWILSVSLLHLPLQFIGLLFCSFYAIFETLFVRVLSFLWPSLWSSVHTVMLIELVTKAIVSLLLDFASSYVDLLFRRRVKKHNVVSQSSIEVECGAMATTTNKIVWLRWLLADMGIPITTPTPLYYDNKSVI